MPHHLRFARPVSDLARAETQYVQGLGLRVLGRFTDHDGFDGVMLGAEGADHHFEFTCCRQHPVPPSPSAEDLIVLYLPDQDEWQQGCERLLAAGFQPVASFNPYWDRRGCSFADADGYRVVLHNAAWVPGLAGVPAAPVIDYDELEQALYWVSGASYDNAAYVSRERGTVHWTSSDGGVEEDLPDDIEDDSRYLAVPHKNELDLGRRLVQRFADEVLTPQLADQVAGIFGKRGAYGRFKDLLARHDLLDEWHAYEQRATEQALRAWCEAEGLQLGPRIPPRAAG